MCCDLTLWPLVNLSYLTVHYHNILLAHAHPTMFYIRLVTLKASVHFARLNHNLKCHTPTQITKTTGTIQVTNCEGQYCNYSTCQNDYSIAYFNHISYCITELPLMAEFVCPLYRHIIYSYVNKACLNPVLNESLAVQYFECGDVIKTHNGIIYSILSKTASTNNCIIIAISLTQTLEIL